MARALFENKPIREENFIFEDKWGKFFMYSSYCKMFTDRNKLEIWSEDTPDGKPWLMNIKATLIKDGIFSKLSPRGSEAYIRFDYHAIKSGDFYYAVENIIDMSQGYRIMKNLPGETVYMIIDSNNGYKFVTKEQFYDVQFIEENVIRPRSTAVQTEKQPTAEEKTDKKELKFYLMADPHYFASSLGCSGDEYEDFMHYEQKCFAETESINKSVFEFLKKANEADIVLICGDLIFNGEKKSHEGFLKLLYSLRESGKKIYVVTADHDFKQTREETFAFGEEGRYSPENTKREELAALYKDFGFGDALAFDEEHLSYVAQLGEGVRLMCINCDIKEGGKYHFFPEQREWIHTQAQKARQDGQKLIAMCHYPILPGQPLFSIISPMMIRDAYDFACFLADEGVELLFTGHMHNQSINSITTEKGNTLYDITTGSIIADPAYIRLVTIREGEAEIKSIPTPDFEWDTDGKDCKQYLSDMFDRMIVNVLTDFRDDTERAMGKFHLKDEGMTKKLLKIAGRFICKVRVGTLARLLLIPCDKSIRKMKVLDYAAQLVRGAFEGNQTFKEGTPEGDVFLALLKRIRPILKKLDIKAWDGGKADMYEILKNTAGNYGIDDYNAVLKM